MSSHSVLAKFFMRQIHSSYVYSTSKRSLALVSLGHAFVDKNEHLFRDRADLPNLIIPQHEEGIVLLNGRFLWYSMSKGSFFW